MKRLLPFFASFFLIFAFFAFFSPNKAEAKPDKPKGLSATTSCEGSNSFVTFRWDTSGYSHDYTAVNWNLIINDKNFEVSNTSAMPHKYNATGDPAGTSYAWRVENSDDNCVLDCNNASDSQTINRRTCAQDPGPQPEPGEIVGTAIPRSLNKGGNVAITISGIPNNEEGNGYIIVGVQTNTYEATVRILQNAGSCALDQHDGDWVSGSTSCAVSGNLATFTGRVDTNNFGNLDPTNDTVFNVFFRDNTYASFTINGTEPNPAGFEISSITPNPVTAGGTIQINLGSITKFGKYAYQIAGQDVHQQDCSTATCTLNLAIPGSYDTETEITINVLDPQGNRRSQGVVVVPQSEADKNTPLSQPCGKGPSFDPVRGCVRVMSAFGWIPTDVGQFTRWMLGFVLGISGGIVIILIIISGYRLMTSQGDPEKIKNAKDQLTAAVVGLLFIIFSLVILELITRDILGLPGFG